MTYASVKIFFQKSILEGFSLLKAYFVLLKNLQWNILQKWGKQCPHELKFSDTKCVIRKKNSLEADIAKSVFLNKT